jgi:hypothetical protein
MGLKKMTNSTLTKKLAEAGINTTPIDLHGVVDPGQLWVFPESWQPISAEGLPAQSLVSANLAETVEGQTSVTVTSAWTLTGRVDPLSLLTGFVDPPPAGGEVVSTWQDGPAATWSGAGVTMSIVYRVNGLKLTGFTRFDVLTSSSSRDEAAGGVLVQRTFNSPVVALRPQCAGLSPRVVDALCAQTGGQ